MAEKIVVLNSGGFDSVVLMNDIRNFFQPDADIYSLHFLYGAPNEKMQRKCAKKVCTKVNAHYKEIRLPKFSWTKNDFYTKGENIYLENRNYVFLAYALSYAESIGAKKICLATLKSINYVDTSVEFLEYVNKISNLYGIKVIAPYSALEKRFLLEYATKYGITEKDFFSCDTPVNGKPCHKCNDCVFLDDFYNNNVPVKAFIRNGNNIDDEEFKKLFYSTPIFEARLLINNLCQLKCKHCFYGFDEMLGEELTKEEYKDVIRKCVAEFGNINFHFSGKEPFFNEDIFEYTDFIKNTFPMCTYDVVTNGVNVEKYIDKIKSAGFSRICLSYDDFSDGTIRKYRVEDTIKLLDANKIPVEIFIDLHKGNFDKLKDGINNVVKYLCVQGIYVRTIRSIGNAESISNLSLETLDKVYIDLLDLADENPDVMFTFNVSSEYAYRLREGNYELSKAINYLEGSFSVDILPNFDIYAEIYCGRYDGVITITPDGYVLGCASEVSYPEYDKLSAGNVRDNISLKDLVLKGKKESIELQKSNCTKKGKYCLELCPYTLNCINNSDNI